MPIGNKRNRVEMVSKSKPLGFIFINVCRGKKLNRWTNILQGRTTGLRNDHPSAKENRARRRNIH